VQKKINFLISSSVVLILSGCVGAMPEYNSSKSSFIVFKTPTIRYADQGFVSNASSETKVEIYGSGQAVMRLRITPSQVCMSSLACMNGTEFNKKVLNANYPADTLEKIFKGEEIFGGEAAKMVSNGFIQHIKRANMNITYSVNGKNIKFVDTIAGVKIEVR